MNSSAHDICGYISPDGRMLLLNGYETGPFRPGGYGGSDIWVTTWTTISDAWSAPVNLGPTVNSPAIDGQPAISADGSTIFFMSTRPGGFGGHDLWQAPIIPIVDFSGDGIVDAIDICMMIDHWDEAYSLCDIGPMPWGDGVVDVQDLTVLAEYIGKDVGDPTLVAHWALDETDGGWASDSAGENHGMVMGVPAWQPDGGKVGGALEFDGATFVVADSVLNPSDGPFSVLAWVKGGAPGQALISQVAGVNWLMLDPATGALMTELKSGGRLGNPLYSEAVISGDGWHRVAFVWDGVNRMLYADEVLVASDTQSNLGGCAGSLTFGRSSTMIPGTSWTGLIDDVRIYNRVVKP